MLTGQGFTVRVLNSKGYTGYMEFNDEAGFFHGELLSGAGESLNKWVNDTLQSA